MEAQKTEGENMKENIKNDKKERIADKSKIKSYPLVMKIAYK